MQEMLRALNHRRPARLFGDVDDAFHAQKVRSEILLQGVKQKSQRLARDRLFAREAERGDVAIVQVVMIVVMIVSVMRVMMMRIRRFVRGGIEPRACVGFGVVRIEPLGAKQRDVKAGIVDARNDRRRIEPPQPGGERRLRFGNARRIDEIKLGDQDMVGERDLADGFDMIVERRRASCSALRRHTIPTDDCEQKHNHSDALHANASLRRNARPIAVERIMETPLSGQSTG